MENRALGKGLSALIPERMDSEKKESGLFVKTVLIKENSMQPRMDFNDKKLSDLVASIKEKGVLQPILVRRSGDGYEVIAGERRLRAARSLGLEEVPVIVRAVDDREALVLGLVENIQREELNPIEEAKAFKRLIEDFKFTQDDVAQSVAKDRTTITNLLRLLKLPEEIQESIIEEKISAGHARALLSVENQIQQLKIFHQAIKKSLSVRELEHFIKRETEGGGHLKKPSAGRNKDPHLAGIEEDLQRALGTKVRIQANKKRGKILIEYYSSEDLERIIGVISK